MLNIDNELHNNRNFQYILEDDYFLHFIYVLKTIHSRDKTQTKYQIHNFLARTGSHFEQKMYETFHHVKKIELSRKYEIKIAPFIWMHILWIGFWGVICSAKVLF